MCPIYSSMTCVPKIEMGAYTIQSEPQKRFIGMTGIFSDYEDCFELDVWSKGTTG